MYKYECPKCGTIYNTPDAHKGHDVDCPACCAVSEKVDLGAVQKVVDAATPGPWIDMSSEDEIRAICAAPDGPDGALIPLFMCYEHEDRAHDRAFTCAARTALPTVIGELKQAQELYRISHANMIEANDQNAKLQVALLKARSRVRELERETADPNTEGDTQCR